jgi:branched-chain amino acid transport system ATP-binding protein
MLQIENISTGYGKKQVLFDVSFTISKGQIILLAGSNGSGKSTVLKAIYGLLPIWNKGSILFNGENITGKQPAELLRKGLLYVPQKNNVFEDLTVLESLQIAGLTLGEKLCKKRIDDVLSIFPMLKTMLHQVPAQMSGGERQLLILAMATLHQPSLILLDEPLTGLSQENVHFVIQNLKAINHSSHITMIIVEHRVQEISKLADTVIGLKLGRFFSSNTIDEKFSVGQLNPVFV